MKTIMKITKWIAFLAILGLLIGLLASCKKNNQIEPIPIKVDTIARQFNVVSLYPQSWIVLKNNEWLQSSIIDTIDATHISTKFYIHKGDSIRFVDNGPIIDNKLYIFNPNVLIYHKQCNNCIMDYKFKMN